MILCFIWVLRHCRCNWPLLYENIINIIKPDLITVKENRSNWLNQLCHHCHPFKGVIAFAVTCTACRVSLWGHAARYYHVTAFLRITWLRAELASCCGRQHEVAYVNSRLTMMELQEWSQRITQPIARSWSRHEDLILKSARRTILMQF